MLARQSRLLLLSTFLSATFTTASTDTISIESLPTDLDTNLWTPLATIYPSFTASNTPGATATSNAQELHIQERQVTGQGAAIALPPVPTQISPVTTYGIGIVDRAGVHQYVQVVYTQKFSKVPDQWESPKAGVIGMGTIQGQVGMVRTKRGLEVDVPLPTPPVQEAVLQVIPEHTIQQHDEKEDIHSDPPHLLVKQAENGSSRNTGLTSIPISAAILGLGITTILFI